jgi:hypothetical protein
VIQPVYGKKSRQHLNHIGRGNGVSIRFIGFLQHMTEFGELEKKSSSSITVTLVKFGKIKIPKSSFEDLAISGSGSNLAEW